MSQARPTHLSSSFKEPGPTITMSGGPSGALAGRRNVPLRLPLPFLLTGVCAAALFGLLLPWIGPEALQAPGFPHVLALVHLVTLGWLTMTIMGASLQLVPVIAVTTLRTTRFTGWHYPLFAGGVLILLSGFWWMQTTLLIAGGTLIALAVVQYVVTLGMTLKHATAQPLTVRFLVASLCFLCLVISLGLTAALDFRFGFLDAGLDRLLLIHLTLGIVGWLTNLVIGVSYTLVRLFALVHGHDERPGKRIFLLLQAGILALASGFLCSWYPLVLAGGVVLVGACWLFALDYARMLRLRRRKRLDVTHYHGIAAVVYLALVMPAGLAAVLLEVGQPAVFVALGLAALVGWIGQSAIGYLYKIVPFLVWNERYGPLVGRQKVPLMRDMLSERVAWVSLGCINFGLPVSIFAALLGLVIPFQIGSSLLGAGLLLAAINIVSIVRHLNHSR